MFNILFLDNIISTFSALPTYGKVIIGILLFFLFYSIIKRFVKIAIMLAILVILILVIVKILLMP
jgi:hypothetical protein